MSLVTTQKTAQVSKSITVTPSDTETIAVTESLPLGPTRGLLVDVAGAVKVTYCDGTTDNPYLAAGVWHPMNVVQVWDAGTDATGIHAGW